MKIINAIGKACPMPVLMAKKEIDQGEQEFLVQVDNKVAVENLKRLASNQGFEIQIAEKDENYQISFAKEVDGCQKVLEEFQHIEELQPRSYTIFIGKDTIGEGDKTLGQSLMQMFLYTLTQSESLPECIIFMNGGVKIAVEETQNIEHLQELCKKGVEILVCGTCLNYYGLSEKLQVGTISNMYDIVSKMQSTGKMITI